MHPRGELRVHAQDDRLYLDLHWRGRTAGRWALGATVVGSAGFGSGTGSIRYDALVPARGQWFGLAAGAPGPGR